MAKKFITFIALGVLVIMAFGLFTGCGGNDNKPLPNNARIIYSIYSASEPLRDDFCIENMIAGGYYGFDDEHKVIFADDSCPLTRTFIVREQNEYEQMHAQPMGIDFEKEMLVVYTFGNSDSSGKIIIKDVSLNDETLCIYWTREKVKRNSHYKGPGTAEPRQIWLGVVMDKLDITSAEFTKV